MSEVKALEGLLELIRDDGYAISFQSLDQYRVALANEIKRQVRGLDRDAVTGNVEPKFHYYSFAFSQENSQASIYIGYGDRAVTMARIQDAKESLDLVGTAVLLSCCYLGYMTRAEMTPEGYAWPSPV